MMQVLLAVEIIVAILLVATILMQRSEGGALGMGGGSGVGGLMTARGAGDLLTRATGVLAFLFIGLSLALAIMAGNRSDGTSVFDDVQLEGASPVSEEDFGDVDSDLPSLELPVTNQDADEAETLADPEEDTDQ